MAFSLVGVNGFGLGPCRVVVLRPVIGGGLPPDTALTFAAIFTDSACRGFLDGIVDILVAIFHISDVHITMSRAYDLRVPHICIVIATE